MNKKLVIVSSLSAILLPVVAFAADVPILPLPTLGTITIYGIINTIFAILWPVFAAYAVVMFILAGVQFLQARGGDISEARNSVIWGTVGVGVALLAFTIPFMVKNLLNV